MPVSVTSLQLDMMRHALDTLYTRSNAYAARLAGLDLNEKERDILVQQHKAFVGKQAMDDLEHVFGRFDPPPRDPTEAACP